MNLDNEIERVLVKAFEDVRDDIIANYYAKNMKASGALPDSLEVVYSNKTVSLYGNQYAEQLEYGRNPSNSMPPLQAMFEWVINKGLISRSEKEYKIKSLAYMVARKIKEKGYDRKGYGGVGLISEVLTDERIKSIINLVGSNLFGIFEAEILTFFKPLEND